MPCSRKMPGFHAPWTEILIFFFNVPHRFFCSFLNNVEIIVHKICFRKEKLRSLTVQDRQIQAKLWQWPSEILLFILVLGARARCTTWHVNLLAQSCAVRMRRNNWRERLLSKTSTWSGMTSTSIKLESAIYSRDTVT